MTTSNIDANIRFLAGTDIDDTGARHCIEHGNYEHVDHADKEPKQSDLKSLQNLTGKVRVLEDEDALITIFETQDEIYVMEFEYK